MNTFGPERSFFFVGETWDYLFLGLLAFTVDLTEPLELTFVFGASTAVRVSALSVSAVSRACGRSALACSTLHFHRFVGTPHRVLHCVGV